MYLPLRAFDITLTRRILNYLVQQVIDGSCLSMRSGGPLHTAPIYVQPLDDFSPRTQPAQQPLNNNNNNNNNDNNKFGLF